MQCSDTSVHSQRSRQVHSAEFAGGIHGGHTHCLLRLLWLHHLHLHHRLLLQLHLRLLLPLLQLRELLLQLLQLLHLKRLPKHRQQHAQHVDFMSNHCRRHEHQ